MKKLTVIIPFLNEGIEVRRTLESMWAHGGEQVEVVLVNDASEDGYDYRQVAKDFGAQYIEHAERCGVSASRDEGVEYCATPFFLFLDGHMRFYTENWIDRIVEELEKDSRQILCCQTKVLNKTDGGEVVEVSNRAKVYGARIRFCDSEKVLACEWKLEEAKPGALTEEIPCVLGATYAASKFYWQYLKGLKGLLCYGSEEEYMSIKTWLEGGRCLLLKDVIIGHIYRKRFVYSVDMACVFYNKMLIAELLLPLNLKQQVFKGLEMQNENTYAKAFQLLIENKGLVKQMKDYYHTICKRDFDLIVQLNNGH